MVPYFGIPGEDAATREAMRALEAERAAREAYEAERATREALQANQAARDAASARDAAMLRDATIADGVRRGLEAPMTDLSSERADSHARLAAQSVAESPTLRMIRAIEDSPTARMIRAIEDSPTARMMRAIEDSPTARMTRQFEQSPALQMMRGLNESPALRWMREIEESPAAQLSRSIAENIKSLDRLSNPAWAAGVLSDRGAAASIAGIAALHDWSAGLRVRQHWAVSPAMASQFSAFAAFTDMSRQWMEQLNAVNAFTGLPAYLQVAPTLESYASASTLHLFLPPGTDVRHIHVIDLIAEDMLDGVTDEFEARLASLDQALLKPVRGAWQTALSDTEDRVRQSAASIRFVVEEMIKQLAPREQADSWAQSVGCSRKPPKEARLVRSAGRWTVQLRFIMRHVDSFPESTDNDSLFGDLIDADLVDMLQLLERLNQAVHEPEAHIAEEDLSLVLRRVMAFMTLLLDVYEFEGPKP